MKKTNKGFSLVELIIVIAIMAILIGVLAPQYIKYVEKSRKSADKDSMDTLKNAIQTACSDEDYVSSLDGTSESAQITSGGASATADLSAPLSEYFATFGNVKLKSKTFKDSTYTVSTSISNGVLYVQESFHPGDY